LEPLKTIANLHCAAFFIHGELEKQITDKEICELFERCPSSQKSLWLVSGADHLQVPFAQTGGFLSGLYGLIQSAK
jgi:hypothetical protein